MGAVTLIGCTFRNNQGWATFFDTLRTSFTAAQFQNLTATGNGVNAIGFNKGTIGSAATWDTSHLGIPLILDGAVTVASCGSLTVVPGSTLALAVEWITEVQGGSTPVTNTLSGSQGILVHGGGSATISGSMVTMVTESTNGIQVGTSVSDSGLFL